MTDNEQYDSCKYNINLTYQGVAMRLDFGADINLGRIRNVADEGAVRTSFFRFDEGGWQVVGDDIVLDKSGLVIHEDKKTIALSGIVQRTSESAKKNDFCFTVDIIGENKYATGAVCRKNKSELLPINNLFGMHRIIWSTD